MLVAAALAVVVVVVVVEGAVVVVVAIYAADILKVSASSGLLAVFAAWAGEGQREHSWESCLA